MIKKIILLMALSLSLHANCSLWEDEPYDRYLHCQEIDSDLFIIQHNLAFIKTEDNRMEVEYIEEKVIHARSILFGDMTHPFD